MKANLPSARRRLTASYVGVFATVLLLFGAGTLLIVRREAAVHLDESLDAGLAAIQRAAAIREREQVSGAVDAFEEMMLPDRDLYVFDANGDLLHPARAAPWIARTARSALESGEATLLQESGGPRWRARARRFQTPGGRTMVGVAVGRNVVEEHFARMLLGFGLAGVAALALAAVGGSWLAVRATAPAEAAFEHMRRFTADAAHELRTPLSVVRARGEVALIRDRDPEEYREALRDVVRETERLGGVVEKLLILASADAGGFVLKRDRMYLDDVVEGALASLRPVARERQVRLELEAPEATQVAGDSGLLQHLVLILVDNAIHYGDAGGTVRVRVDRADRLARLLVKDEGPGIDPALLPFVFERFFRGNPVHGRVAGAGLGLSIARWIAEVHGGSVTLQSTPGAGTTAEVLLPLA